MWRDELKRAISEAAEHLSLYQLTIEHGTPFFGLHAAGKLQTPDEETAARALRRDAGGLRRRRACRPTRFPTTRGPAPSAGTISSTGAARNMPASVPARMAVSISTACVTRIATEKRPEAWLMRVEATGDGVVADDHAQQRRARRRISADGAAAAEGIDPERYAALSGRSLDPDRIAILRDEGAIAVDADGRLRVTQSGFPVLDAVVADLAA